MPPRALMEPEIGSSLSHLSSSLPSIGTPLCSSRAFFMRGISRSGDSRIPPETAVSGKAAAR